MAHHLRGCVYAELGERDLAVRNFSRVIALDPEDAASLRHRAAMCGELSQPEQAVRDYDGVRRPEPGDLSPREERRLAVAEAEVQGH